MKRFEQVTIVNYKTKEIEEAFETEKTIEMIKNRVKKDYKKKLRISMVYKRDGDRFIINTCTKKHMEKEKYKQVCRYVLANHIGE